MQIPSVTTKKKNRRLRLPLRIDMTPMVDLGFLLITFFIYTTTMAEHKSATLFMPADGPATTVGESNVVTIILHKNVVYYYTGKWDDAMKNNQVGKTTFNVHNGIGKIIREKQKTLGTKWNNLMLLIKPSDEATYNDVINALDEVMINEVKKYAIVELTQQEKAFLIQYFHT